MSDTITNGWFDEMRRLYGASPIHEHLKMTLDEVGEGTVRVGLDTKPEFVNAHGTVHGGMLTTGLDSAILQAVRTRCGPDDKLTTVELKVNFLEPAASPRIAFTGRAVRVGGSLGVAMAEAVSDDGRHVATAIGTIAIRRLR